MPNCTSRHAICSKQQSFGQSVYFNNVNGIRIGVIRNSFDINKMDYVLPDANEVPLVDELAVD